MGNIMDYISWRGDLTFAQSPFNEVDNLILACFSYVNLDRIPAVTRQKGIELKKLVKEFKKLHTIKELEADKSFIRLAPFMMFEMAESVRFGNCVIRNYVNEIVTEAEQQFSAVEIVLEKSSAGTCHDNRLFLMFEKCSYDGIFRDNPNDLRHHLCCLGRFLKFL